MSIVVASPHLDDHKRVVKNRHLTHQLVDRGVTVPILFEVFVVQQGVWGRVRSDPRQIDGTNYSLPLFTGQLPSPPTVRALALKRLT